MISIIVPVYQASQYLETCLRSLQEQTYRDWEAILIDDGSTDESGEICERFSASDERFFVFHQENAGVSAARNAGLAKARGEYVGFVDADDWAHPDLFGHLAEQMTEGVDLAVCGFTSNWEDAAEENMRNESCVLSEEEALPLFFTDYDFQMAIWNKLYRRDIIEAEDPIRFSTELTHGEDGLWLCRYLTRCKQVVWTKKALYGYRLTETSAMRGGAKFNPKKMSVLDANEQMIRVVKEAGKTEAVTRAAKAHAVSVAVGLYVEAMEKNLQEQAMFERIHRVIRENGGSFLREKAYPWMDRCYGTLLGLCPGLFRLLHKTCKNE